MRPSAPSRLERYTSWSTGSSGASASSQRWWTCSKVTIEAAINCGIFRMGRSTERDRKGRTFVSEGSDAADRIRHAGPAGAGGRVPEAAPGRLARDAGRSDDGGLLELLDLHARPGPVRVHGGRRLRPYAPRAR